MSSNDRNAASETCLSDQELQFQNTEYRSTGGISEENAGAGFAPAFHNSASGETVVSCYADGRPALIHILDGLPDAWVTGRDADGRVTEVAQSVSAGFVRAGVFYSRADAARALVQDAPMVDEVPGPGLRPCRVPS